MKMDAMTRDSLTQLRQFLHRFPELSMEEQSTSRHITEFLKGLGVPDIVTGLGGTGVAAVFDSGKRGKTVLLRCELDALPIHEINRFRYRSGTDGISHKCGHDGHMAIVCGVANALCEKPPRKGRAILLFQPGEEDGRGAAAVLADPKFDPIRPDMVFALHNLPGYPLGTVVCRTGAFTAAVNSMILQFQGKTSHAGEPDKGINPALAIAGLLTEAHTYQTDPDAKEYRVVTPIQIEMGEEAYGISAGEGTVRLTYRSFDNASMNELGERLEALAKREADRYGLKLTIDHTQYFAANQNDQKMVAVVRKAAREQGLEYIRKKESFRWGEDFGLFTEQFPGAMFGLGAGADTPALHHPDYDFPDPLIPHGVAMFRRILDQFLA